jgi:hypothetical protein
MTAFITLHEPVEFSVNDRQRTVPVETVIAVDQIVSASTVFLRQRSGDTDPNTKVGSIVTLTTGVSLPVEEQPRTILELCSAAEAAIEKEAARVCYDV